MRETELTGRAPLAVVAGGGVAALLAVQQRNYLLFHSLVELFSILVAFSVFVIIWNTWERLENPVLLVVGIAYLFVGAGDLLHTLSYSGMGVFPNTGADVPTQLWVFTRYVEAVSLVGAAVVGTAVQPGMLTSQGRRRILSPLLVVYTGTFAAGVGAIVITDAFPSAYVEGSGLTPFKIVSEYVIIGLLALALGLLYRVRERFDPGVFRLFGVALLCTIGAEFAFTAYADVYGSSNAVGHVLKLGSFGAIYLAVVRTGLTEPQRMLYRRLAEREAEARTFEKAVEHSGHAVVITDRDGAIEYVNPAYEEITGYTAAELQGENPRVLQSGVHDAAFYEELWSTLRSGEVWHGEVVNEDKDGKQFVVNQTIAPIVQDGTAERFVGVHRDITSRKARERQLQHRYEVLFESIRDAIVVVDTDHRIVDANAAFTDLFGYELADVEGEPTERLFDDPDDARVIARAIQRHRGDERFTRVVDYERASGQVFPGRTTVFYRRDGSGALTGFISLVRDVSDREEQVQQMQVLGRVLRHNLRNDMNVVEGFAQAIQAETTGQSAEYADRIASKSDSVMTLADKEYAITQFLAAPPEIRQVDLVSLLDHVVAETRAAHPEATISTDLPADCPVTTTASMQRAVTEVILNAVVHSDREHPHVWLACERADGTVRLRVADDGPGIPEMEQRVLGGEADIEPLYHGSGLGLWLVSVIVDHSDGDVTFEENDPRGSVVSITMPSAETPPDRTRPPPGDVGDSDTVRDR